MNSIDISIIIPTKDRDDVFKRTLATVLESTECISAEVIVINDSDRPIFGFDDYLNLKIYRNPKSGAASARNFGAAQAKGKVLLFVDNDVLVSAANLNQILFFHKKYESSCFNFFWFYPPDLIEKLPNYSFGRFLLNNLIFSNSSRIGKGNIKQMEGLVSVDGLASYFLSINKADFEMIGGYEEKIPKAGVEDMILAKQMRKYGLKMYMSMADVVFHNEADRLELVNTMGIYKSHALTRRVAVDMGHEDVKMEMKPTKLALYKFLLPLKAVFVSILRILPNHLAFDFIYFRVVNILLSLSSIEGYYFSGNK